MSSDPRVHKPRLPKAYTVQQLAFLKRYGSRIPMLTWSSFLSSSLPEFERRSHASIRGDAKKFALEKAQDFIVRFGLPDEFIGVEEPESRFKEVLNILSVYPSFPNDKSNSKSTTGSRTPLGGQDASWRVDLVLERRLRTRVSITLLRGFSASC